MTQPNTRLSELRRTTPSPDDRYRCMTRTELADAVNRYLWNQYHASGALDRKYLGRLERGEVTWPNGRYREALRAVLRVDTDQQLGFYSYNTLRPALLLPEGNGLELPWTTAGALDGAAILSEVGPMTTRRDFLATAATLFSSATLARLGLDWLSAPAAAAPGREPGGTRVGQSDLDARAQLQDELRHMDDQVGGGLVLDMAKAHLADVAALLVVGAYSDPVGRQLHSLHAGAAQLVGWLCWDTRQYALAQHYLEAALHNAHAAGDNAVGANTMSFMAAMAGELGQRREAITLASAARLRATGSPRVAAIAHSIYAEAAAAVGEHREARAATDAAWTALGKDHAGAPAWSYWVATGAYEMAGRSAMFLGRHGEAADRLGEFIGLTGESREGARGLTYLAEAHARGDNPDEAARVATRAVHLVARDDIASPRCVDRLRSVQARLAPCDTPAVRSFTEQLVEMLGAA